MRFIAVLLLTVFPSAAAILTASASITCDARAFGGPPIIQLSSGGASIICMVNGVGSGGTKSVAAATSESSASIGNISASGGVGTNWAGDARADSMASYSDTLVLVGGMGNGLLI